MSNNPRDSDRRRNGNADNDNSPQPITITPKKVISLIAPFVIYLLSIGIYLHPLTLAPTLSNNPLSKQKWSLIYSPKPQLDELHIMSTDNHDIHPQPTTSWTEAWHNDYWGRPLTMESSHKSWRPISVWSFRFGKGGEMGRKLIAIVGKAVGGFMEGIMGLFGMDFGSGDDTSYTDNFSRGGDAASELFVHRFINVLIHAAIVQLVGTVAVLLFSSPNHRKNSVHLYTKYIAQLLFALHPVHVEAVANVANRPHILALLFNATILDPDVPLVAVAILSTLGLLTAETAIFQFPAIVLTMTAIRFRELSFERNRKGDGTDKETSQSPLSKTIITLLPRYILLVIISFTFLLYRHYNDTLSIPEGLIRPAENPFYNKLEKDEWSLEKRTMNYSYILSLHIMKSFGIELIGSSHEYGFDCIPEIESIRDSRLLLPAEQFFAFCGMLVWAVGGWHVSQDAKRSRKWRGDFEERFHRVLNVLVFFSWMATLFPISGILKVGTFVADRIAVASTFGTCIFAARILAVWITFSGTNTTVDAEGKPVHTKAKRNHTLLIKMVIIFYLCAGDLAKRTHNRVAEWMDSVPLLESSLRSCPRSTKSNLEMSKIYSGLVPHMMDLKKSLELITTAQSIDPDFCDVHQQYAHVYFQQSKYIQFEKEMVKSLMCPFTMGQAMNNWNKYWTAVLHGGKDREAQKRYEQYMMKIKAEVARVEMEEKMKKRGVSRTGGAQSTAGNEEL